VDELDLPSVPEYNPTAEQFKDPLAYIQTIYDQAALYGVCIINPPKESWKVSVGPKDWESACKTAGRLEAFDVKKQRLLNAQRKTGDPGFEYYNKQLNLAQYEKETKRFQEQVRKSLPRPVDIDDEIDVETSFFDTMAREAGTSVIARLACESYCARLTRPPVCAGGTQTVIYGNDVEGTLLENDDAVKDNPWAPMRISLHGESAVLALSSPVVRSAILRRGHPLICTMLIQPTLPSELLEMTAPGSLARTCILGCFSLSFVGTLKTTISTRSIT
jgi:hypothetical protein